MTVSPALIDTEKRRESDTEKGRRGNAAGDSQHLSK